MPPFPRALGEVGPETWGRARGPGWGTPHQPLLHHFTRPRLSLLLPAVTGVPSPRATDPPSHVRPLFFRVKPAAPSADPVPWSLFRAHPTSLGFQVADTLCSAPHLSNLPRFRPLAKFRPGSPSIPSPISASLAVSCPPTPHPHPAEAAGWAGLRSGHLSLLSSARWPPARGSGPVLAGGAKPHAPPPPAAPCQGTSGCSHPPAWAAAATPPPRSTHPKPLGLAVHLQGLAGAERKGARAANQHRLLGSSQ